ncbi:MAG: ABC1 kinase family protein [Planctomycetota bacterium]|jgi:predicted unusual protein kinase regulating ubiquinone biosynthesis (AarF/ABC1/UbiB family)
MPTGAIRRFGVLTGLHARVGLAYLAYWARGCFQNADRRQAALVETNLKAAVKTLSTMGYLRGAVMKLGQTAANFPDIVPGEFVDTLSRLHFEAPPMHWSLIREVLHDELGRDPEDVFASFDTTAFAAASLGQVHRATLKSGQNVAVKVQYPGISRTIRSDFRNLSMLMLPLRFTKDWECLQPQLEEVRTVLEAETDYEKEAENLRRARSVFQDEDLITVPRSYDEFSTRRVLTMDFLDGSSFPQFLRGNPSQEERNHYGSLVTRSVCRLVYAARMQYADPHPGNYLFLPDGRLGILDFGCVRFFDDADWEYLRGADAAVIGGRDEAEAHMRRGTDFTEQELTNPELMDAMIEYADWMWEAMRSEEPYDFGDPDVMRRGIALIRSFAARGWRPAQKPVNVFIQRSALAGWGIQHHLRSHVPVKAIMDEEIQVTGWRQQTA